MDWQDAAELILAGATAVGVGTALFADPRAVGRIADGLGRWVQRQGCTSIGELVGGALP
jgi:dihydroorotate dehydrogenase (NAD+) catalytic subunit